MTHTWKLPERVNPKSLFAANVTRPTRSIEQKVQLVVRPKNREELMDRTTRSMLVLAKPTPAVTAKTNVIAHTAHPASEVARCRDCQSLAA
jgi:hypothetical protein